MSSVKTAISLLRTPGKMLLPIADKGLLNWMPDRMYLKLAYRMQMEIRLDLKNPQTFNEKLQWLKLNDRNRLYVKMVDKYEAKEYIASIVGKEFIIPTISIWKKADDIDPKELPNQFVLKCTHDSGSIVICKDKNTFNWEAAKRKLQKHMKKSMYWFGREWPYKNVQPRIIAEPFLEDSVTGELIDYKIHCFNGKAKLILVCSGRFKGGGLTEDFFDTEWNHLNVRRPGHNNSIEIIDRPAKLSKMISIAEQLSKNNIFLRVDFYVVNQKLYIGELTFYPAAGFETFIPESFDTVMGSWMKLS